MRIQVRCDKRKSGYNELCTKWPRFEQRLRGTHMGRLRTSKMVRSRTPTYNNDIKRLQAEQQTPCHEGDLTCSIRHTKSFPNNQSRILRVHVVLHVVSGRAVAPANWSMVLLQGVAELLLRRTDQHESLHCRSLPPHFHSPAQHGATIEVPSSRARNPVCIQRHEEQ